MTQQPQQRGARRAVPQVGPGRWSVLLFFLSPKETLLEFSGQVIPDPAFPLQVCWLTGIRYWKYLWPSEGNLL
jgi:hypothetical protein